MCVEFWCDDIRLGIQWQGKDYRVPMVGEQVVYLAYAYDVVGILTRVYSNTKPTLHIVLKRGAKIDSYS